jgi:Superoxide dismutase
MDRKKFLKTSAILAGTTILPSNSIFANNINKNGIEKITDDKGNFIQQSLPYNIDHLEPFMDSETLDLHHSFIMGC